MIFIDTSAFYALLDKQDQNHQLAAHFWTHNLALKQWFSHNYILVETSALIQRRLGIAAVQAFQYQILPVVNLVWINQDIHQLALTALCASQSKKVSLVDQVSFQVMRIHNIPDAFAFDQDFLTAGFKTLPPTN